MGATRCVWNWTSFDTCRHYLGSNEITTLLPVGRKCSQPTARYYPGMRIEGQVVRRCSQLGDSPSQIHAQSAVAKPTCLPACLPRAARNPAHYSHRNWKQVSSCALEDVTKWWSSVPNSCWDSVCFVIATNVLQEKFFFFFFVRTWGENSVCVSQLSLTLLRESDIYTTHTWVLSTAQKTKISHSKRIITKPALFYVKGIYPLRICLSKTHSQLDILLDSSFGNLVQYSLRRRANHCSDKWILHLPFR
jgi:hypothetical protein